MNKNITALSLFAILFVPFISRAQDEVQQTDNSPQEDTPTEVATNAADGGPSNEELLEELNKQKAEIDTLKGKVSKLETQAKLREEKELEEAFAGETTGPRLLDIYGFFDLSLFYFDSPDGSLTDALLPNKLSFVVDSINLYFKSQMTETLSALVELKFTFLPLGYESSFAEPQFFGTEYDRIDTTVTDAHDTEEIRLGGLVIERVHLTWQPADFFGVIAGRFLTPYGIWNIDHGTPVLIPAGLPIFMIRQALPSAQTGLQIFGRFFPARNTYLDYALTLSNGRGPTESVYDLDNNKALGLRLRLTYEGDNASAALGGYLFWGETTDVTKSIVSIEPFATAIEETEKYTELTGSLDLLVKLFGFRLQGEFVRGVVDYAIHPIREIPIINQEDPFEARCPDFIKWGIYGLAAYEFPLELETQMMFLTPYFMGEYYVPDDTYMDYIQIVYRFGLNFRPSTNVVLKAEANYSTFPESDFMEGFWAYLAQLAVSF